MRYAALVLGLLALASLAFAYPTGAPMGYAGNPPNNNSCVNCHSSYPLNSGNGSLQITGLPAAGYETGITYNLTITLTDPGQNRWGFQLTPIYQSGSSYLQAGTLVVTDPTHTSLATGSGTAPDYLDQTSSGTYNGTPGPTSWNFNWTAPNVSTGSLTFYASGAACNGTGGTSGDYIYTTSATVNPAAGTPAVTITLTPSSPPIQIPAAGGSFDYTLAVANTGGTTVSGAIWCDVTLPNGTPYGPVLGPVNVSLPAGFSTNRLRTQSVPGSAPAGNYAFNGYIGTYPGTIWDQDTFPFTKLAVDGNGLVREWITSGEAFGEENASASLEMPSDYVLVNVHPNPFNPSTNISFSLPQAAPVKLAVYSASGREVAVLVNGWRSAGTQEVTFDASDLTSGVYLYQLQAGNYSAIGKLLLVK